MKFDRDTKEYPRSFRELRRFYIMSFGDMIAKRIEKSKQSKDI